MTLFLSYLINGISLGSVYAIIALGYTMVYGIAKMLNFAHGDVIMIGAYVSFCAMQYLGLPALVSVVLAMVACTALGIVIEGLAYKPLRQAPSLAVLITAIGVSYFLQNSALLIWGSAPKSYPSVITLGSINLLDGQLVISGGTIVTVLANIVIMVALTPVHRPNQVRQGHARRLRRQGRGGTDGHQRQRDDLHDLRHRLGAGGRLRACCSAPPTRRSSRRPAPCRASRRLRRLYSAASAPFRAR